MFKLANITARTQLCTIGNSIEKNSEYKLLSPEQILLDIDQPDIHTEDDGGQRIYRDYNEITVDGISFPVSHLYNVILHNDNNRGVKYISLIMEQPDFRNRPISVYYSPYRLALHSNKMEIGETENDTMLPLETISEAQVLKLISDIQDSDIENPNYVGRMISIPMNVTPRTYPIFLGFDDRGMIKFLSVVIDVNE